MYKKFAMLICLMSLTALAFAQQNNAAAPARNNPSISLNKTVYASGEDITVTYSGFGGDATDKIALYYSAWAPSASSPGRYSLWEHVSGADGKITFTNNLALGDYVAVYLQGRKNAIGNRVKFSVVSGIDNGKGVLDYQMFIGPGDVPGSYDFADPAVIKEGNSWFITGTYSMGGRSHYMVETSDWQNKTLHKLSIDMNAAHLKKHFEDPTFWVKHLWKFTPYKHTDGTWHAYGAFMHKSTWTTSIAHFEPLDKQCPCEVCARHSRGYIRHLLQVGEPTASRLLSIHNVAWTIDLMRRMRVAISAFGCGASEIGGAIGRSRDPA